MEVVNKKPVPIYEVECYECKSKIQYKACEIHWSHITCPVCGMSIWADRANPVRYEEVHEWDAWNECGRTGKYGEHMEEKNG